MMRLHLHANFPYDADRPNAAIGYLKSFLSEEKNLETTNIYWNLLPREISGPIFSILKKFQDKRFDKFDPITALTAYFTKLFYEPKVYTSILGPIIGLYTPLEEVEEAARAFKNFIDHSIENGKMADVDIAGFTTNFSQWFISKYIWSQLKELNPNITIVVGGFFTQDEAAGFMNTFKEIDCAIWGEGEIPLRGLVRCIDDKESLDKIPHLIYRDKEGLHFTGNSCGTLTVFPFGDHTDYFEQLKKYELSISPQITIAGTRFCQWNKCKFCHMTRGGIYCERPVSDIVEEIEYQSKKHSVDRFLFVDTDIGRKKEEDFEALLETLLESVDKRKMPYDIVAEVNPVRINRKCAHIMNKIKLGIQIGFEAMTDSLLKGMGKMHRFAENIQALKFGRDYNLSMFALNVIRNLPGEREEDVVQSIKNLKYLRFFLPHYGLKPIELTLYKGTQYYDEIPAEEREKRWVTNFLYSEIKPLIPIEEENRWDFFGFRAHNLMHHQLWEQFIDVLREMQSAHIYYSWLEFRDGSSLIEEYNSITGYKGYSLTELETVILKLCDSITTIKQVKNAFSSVHEADVKNAVSQLRKEGLLFGDESGRVISILSVDALRKVHE